MKNRDLINQQRADFINKMNEAVKNNDTEAFSQAFGDLCKSIEENVMDEARELAGEQDVAILMQRGVRQLTREERTYYEKLIEAMRSADPKQALSDLDVVMPETVIDSIFDNLTTEHHAEHRRRAAGRMGQADCQDHRGADVRFQGGRHDAEQAVRVHPGLQAHAGPRPELA